MRIIAAADFTTDQVDRTMNESTVAEAQAIVDRVRGEGTNAVREFARRFGECEDDQPLWIGLVEAEAPVNIVIGWNRGALVLYMGNNCISELFSCPRQRHTPLNS